MKLKSIREAKTLEEAIEYHEWYAKRRSLYLRIIVISFVLLMFLQSASRF